MREIRFRAWAKDLGKMYVGNNASHLLAMASAYDSIIMQFTGLQDSKGVDIYAGDKIKATHQEQGGKNPYEQIGIVYAGAGGFTLFGKAMSSFYVEQDMKTIKNVMWVSPGSYNVPTIYYEIINFEVIGNIYESPQLLEVKDAKNT